MTLWLPIVICISLVFALSILESRMHIAILQEINWHPHELAIKVLITLANRFAIYQRFHRLSSSSASFLSSSLFLPLSLSLSFFLLFFGVVFQRNDHRHVSRHRRRHFGQFSINGSKFSLWSRTCQAHMIFLFTPFAHPHTHAHAHTYTQSLPLAFSLSLTQLYVRVSIRLVISYWAIVKLYRIIRIRRSCEID